MPSIRMLSARREMLEKEKLKNQGTLRARRDQEMDTQDVAKKTNTSETARALKKALKDASMAAAEEKIAEKKIANAILGQTIGAVGALVGFAVTITKLVKNSDKPAEKPPAEKTPANKGAVSKAGTTTKPDAKSSTAKPESKPEAKPVTAKPETKPEAKDNSTKVEAKPDNKLVASKPEAKPDAKDNTTKVEANSPATSSNPANPATPATPANPAVPSSPASPANPATPAAPGSPATPATPGNPADPAKPATPASPANPANPADPAKPALKPDEKNKQQLSPAEKEAKAAERAQNAQKQEAFEKLFSQLLQVGAGVDTTDMGYKGKKGKEGMGKALDGFKDGWEGKLNNNFSERRDVVKGVMDKGDRFTKLTDISKKSELTAEDKAFLRQNGVKIGDDGKADQKSLGDAIKANTINDDDISNLNRVGVDISKGDIVGNDGSYVGKDKLTGIRNELNEGIRDGKEGRLAGRLYAENMDKKSEELSGVDKAIESAQGDVDAVQRDIDDVDKATTITGEDLNKPENKDLKDRLGKLGLLNENGEINTAAVNSKKAELNTELNQKTSVLSTLNQYRSERSNAIDQQNNGGGTRPSNGISFNIGFKPVQTFKDMYKGANNIIGSFKDASSSKDSRDFEKFLKDNNITNLDPTVKADIMTKLEGKTSLSQLSRETGLSVDQLDNYFNVTPDGNGGSKIGLKNGEDGIFNQIRTAFSSGNNLANDINNGTISTADAAKLLNAMENSPGMSGLSGTVLNKLTPEKRAAILGQQDSSITGRSEFNGLLTGSDGNRSVNLGKLSELKQTDPEKYNKVLQSLGIELSESENDVLGVMKSDGTGIDMTKLDALKTSDPEKYNRVLQTLGVDPANLQPGVNLETTLNNGLKSIQGKVNGGLNTLNSGELQQALIGSGLNLSSDQARELMGNRSDADNVADKVGGAKERTGEGERASTMNMIILGLNASMPAIQFYLQQLDKMREAQDQRNEAQKKKAAANKLVGDLVKDLKRTQSAINDGASAGSIGS